MNDRHGTRKIHHLYFVPDVSESMWPPWTGGERAATAASAAESLLRLIPSTLMALSESPAISTVTSVSVIAFADKPQVLQPMSPLTDPPVVADPEKGTETDYIAILEFLDFRFRADAHAIQRQGGGEVAVAQPLVFFLTDGAPFVGTDYQLPEQWTQARGQLVAGPVKARIATIGLPGAHEPVLWRLATGQDDGEDRNAFIVDADPGPDGLANSIIAYITSDAHASGSTETAIIQTPDGMRRIHRPGATVNDSRRSNRMVRDGSAASDPSR